jgi:hypothetical protein
MKVELKTYCNNKWQSIPIGKIINQSIAQYMADSEDPIVVALYDEINPSPIAYFSNQQKYVDMYRDKGFCMLAEDLLILLGETEPPLPLVATVFPDSEVVSIERQCA